MRIGGLVLAAGEGRRFRGTKQLAEADGRPLLEHALAAVGGLRPRVVVLGHAAPEILARVDLQGAEAVVCEGWSEGQAASLRCGIAALGEVGAAVVVLGDQPRITRAAVDAVAATVSEDADAVRATYGGAPGHPIALGRALLARSGELRGDVGFRDLLAGARVRKLELGGVADPADVDTREELAALAFEPVGDPCGTGVCGDEVPPLIGSVLTGTGLTLDEAVEAFERGESPPLLSAVQRRLVEEHAARTRL